VKQRLVLGGVVGRPEVKAKDILKSIPAWGDQYNPAPALFRVNKPSTYISQCSGGSNLGATWASVQSTTKTTKACDFITERGMYVISGPISSAAHFAT
jgi:hypothetical protein